MLEYSGMKITVLEMDNQRIEKVRIEVRRSQPEPVNAERDVKNG
jgi:CBS domain containing-hemolysin-like protein